MRIRRRASSSLHPSPDPSYSSQNEHRGAKDSIAAQGGKLHRVVIGVGDPPKWPTHPDEASFPCPNPSSDAPIHHDWDSSSGSKVQWRVKKEDEDGNQRGRWQADCSKKISGSSTMVNNGNREEGEGKVEEEQDQRKAKEKTKSSSCCTSSAGEENATDLKRPRRSPAVVMEGSRCSRVNGRGWRCGQQTIVGYSLCEHHLGKGRLRNMSISSRGQVGSSRHRWSTSTDASSNSNTAREIKPDNSIAGGRTRAAKMEQEQAEMTCNKRKKIGTVRARSISSVLDDYDHHSLLPQAQAHQVASLPPLNASGTDNDMKQILEKHSSHSKNLEKQDQVSLDLNLDNNKFVSLKKQVTEASLQLRQMRGEALESLTVEELQQLEKKLEAGLNRVLDRKDAHFTEQINTLQEKALRLAKENLKLRQNVSEIFGMEKELVVEDRENVANEDGQTSESVTNASSHSGGGPPECDDSSDTSLKLGLPYC